MTAPTHGVLVEVGELPGADGELTWLVWVTFTWPVWANLGHLLQTRTLLALERS